MATLLDHAKPCAKNASGKLSTQQHQRHSVFRPQMTTGTRIDGKSGLLSARSITMPCWQIKGFGANRFDHRCVGFN